MQAELAVQWEFLDFPELDTKKLYAILKARTEIFAVEQNCVYCDLDDNDQKAHHLIGWSGDNIAAYLRLIKPGVVFAQPAFGRIITAAPYRRKGLGRELMRRGIEHAKKLYPAEQVRMAVRGYLEKFYEEFGFITISDSYQAYGISFVDMLLIEKK